MENGKHRVLLVSDAHYTTEETHDALLSRAPGANASAAAGPIFGFGQREKIRMCREAILAEHAAAPLDAVFVLGDLSIDDYPFRNLPENYVKKFREDCLEGLPCPFYALAGNHDSYPEALWREVFPQGRQFTVTVEDTLFVMLDTFRAPAKGASGSPYTPVDTDYLREVLAASDARRIFLCAHHISPEAETDEFVRILDGEPRILCMFRGHTHLNGIVNPERFARRCIADIGGFGGYDGMPIGGAYTFQIFSRAWAWGYEIVEWDRASVTLYHAKPSYTYYGLNGSFRTEREISGLLHF